MCNQPRSRRACCTVTSVGGRGSEGQCSTLLLRNIIYGRAANAPSCVTCFILLCYVVQKAFLMPPKQSPAIAIPSHFKPEPNTHDMVPFFFRIQMSDYA